MFSKLLLVRSSSLILDKKFSSHSCRFYRERYLCQIMICESILLKMVRYFGKKTVELIFNSQIILPQ